MPALMMFTRQDRQELVNAFEVYASEQDLEPGISRRVWALATKFSEQADLFEIRGYEITLSILALSYYMSTVHVIDVPLTKELITQFEEARAQ